MSHVKFCALTPREVEHRILTAIKTLDAMADPEHRYLYGAVTLWPKIARDCTDYLGDEDVARERARLARFRPSREEVDLMLPTLDWIGPKVKEWFWLLRARAYNRSYRQIAQMRGRSDEYWRRKFRGLLGDLTAAANGVSVAG